MATNSQKELKDIKLSEMIVTKETDPTVGLIQYVTPGENTKKLATLSTDNMTADICLSVNLGDVVFDEDLEMIGDYTFGNIKKTPNDIYVINSGTTLQEFFTKAFTVQAENK